MAIRNRVTITLSDDVDELLQAVSQLTQLSPASIVSKLLLAHLTELWEYRAWVEQLPEGPSQLRTRATHLIHNYGPDTLLQDIARLDPTYKTDGERLLESAGKSTSAS